MKSTMHLFWWLAALPAAAGIAAGIWLTPAESFPPSTVAVPFPSAGEAASPLPDDPEILKLAAMAGRTREARAKIDDLLAAGAKDEEIAAWLAPILLADPAWRRHSS